MSDGKRFRFTPKRRKVQCSKCDEIFINDYASRHMTKHHPALITAGYTPSLVVKESSQPSVSSFFKKSDEQGVYGMSPNVPDCLSEIGLWLKNQ